MKHVCLFALLLFLSACGCNWRASECDNWINDIQLTLTLWDSDTFNDWEIEDTRPVVLGMPDSADMRAGIWIEEVVNDNYMLNISESWTRGATNVSARRTTDFASGNDIPASQLTLAIHRRDSLGLMQTDSVFFNAGLRFEESDEKCCDFVSTFEFNQFDHSFPAASAQGDVNLTPGISTNRSWVMGDFLLR